MVLNNIKSNKSHGFTIVELLVVIVIIGILAAITIVSYTGISAKANTTTNLSNANGAIQVVDAINAQTGSYPATSALANAGGGGVKMPSGITVSSTAPAGTDNTTKARIQYSTCVANGTGGIGAKISYWDWSTPGLVSIYTGEATSASTCTAV